MRTIRIAAWALVALAAVGLTLAFYFRQSGTAPLSGVVSASIGGPFSLTDQNGNTVTDASLKGHPSAMFFGYTFCPDVCPTTLYDVTTWLETLGPDADRIKVYFVTVDPERDTREAMAEYLKAFDPRIVGLTGTRAEVDQVVKDYRVYARRVDRENDTYLMDHTATIYLLDRNGSFTGVINYQEKPDVAVGKLKSLIAG